MIFDDIWGLAGWVVNYAVGFASYVLSILSFQLHIINLATDVLSFVPAAWSVPVLAGLGGVIALKVYGFVKDLGLNGWKI